MEAENDTSTPVNYEQSGGGGDIGPPQGSGGGPVPPTCPQYGWLDRKGTGNNRRKFVPACRAPWTVKFRDEAGNTAESRPIQQDEVSAQVILHEDWTVTVDPAGPQD